MKKLVNVELLRETDKAFLGWFHDSDTERWLPKSQLRGVYIVGFKGEVTVTDWLAETLAKEQSPSTINANFNKSSTSPAKLEDMALALPNRIFRKLAVKYHPDHTDGSAEVMKDLNELWEAVRVMVRKANTAREE